MDDREASAVDLEYRKILVIGARKTGKTSILSTAVCGDFSKTYRPTARCHHYYDVQNMLELIDTPGLDDTILNGTKDTEEPADFEAIRAHYHNFRDDPIVQELISEPKDRTYKENLLIDIDITQVDSYLILYTDDDRSKRVAKALRLAILTKRIHDNRRAIFLLSHQGDFDLEPFITRLTINEDTRHMDEEKNDPFVELVFRDDVPIQTKAYHHPSVKYLPHCSAQTGAGVHRAFQLLRQELDRMSSKNGGTAAGMRGGKGGKLQRRAVPADLFTLNAAVAMAMAAKKSRESNANTNGHGTQSNGHPSHSSPNKTSSHARKKKKLEMDEEDEFDDDDTALPPSKGQQRAQCTSMAAAACTIQ